MLASVWTLWSKQPPTGDSGDTPGDCRGSAYTAGLETEAHANSTAGEKDRRMPQRIMGTATEDDRMMAGREWARGQRKLKWRKAGPASGNPRPRLQHSSSAVEVYSDDSRWSWTAESLQQLLAAVVAVSTTAAPSGHRIHFAIVSISIPPARKHTYTNTHGHSLVTFTASELNGGAAVIGQLPCAAVHRWLLGSMVCG